MLLSKSCVYGIRSVLLLAVESDKRFISIREIAKKLDIPFHFLTKILQILGHADILESVKGPKGGVALKISPDKLSIMDIISVLDGDRLFQECIMGLNGCSEDDPCILHKSWHKTKHKLEVDFQAGTLKDLAKKIKKGNVKLFDIKENTNN